MESVISIIKFNGSYTCHAILVAPNGTRIALATSITEKEADELCLAFNVELTIVTQTI